MKNIKNQSDEMDQLFREGLNDFQVPPPSGERDEENPLDAHFREELDTFESKPSPEVWNNVKTRIPLSLQMKRQLTWWSKVAAALILGLSVTMIIKEYQNAQSEMVHTPVPNESVLPATTLEEDFVFDTEKDVPTKNEKEDREHSMQQMFDDGSVVVDRSSDIKPIPTLDTKTETVLSQTKNPLDEKQKAVVNHGDMPLRTDGSKVELPPVVSKGNATENEKEGSDNR